MGEFTLNKCPTCCVRFRHIYWLCSRPDTENKIKFPWFNRQHLISYFETPIFLVIWHQELQRPFLHSVKQSGGNLPLIQEVVKGCTLQTFDVGIPQRYSFEESCDRRHAATKSPSPSIHVPCCLNKSPRCSCLNMVNKQPNHQFYNLM